MKPLLFALYGGFQAEIKQLARSPFFVALTILLAVTFLFLVSLFGLTGSRAPTAIITEDQGTYARQFIANLQAAHHSFDLRPMDQASARTALNRGELAAIIILPKNFSDAIAHGKETTIEVSVDNVDTDMTDDIKRALPSAIIAFGRQLHLSTPHVSVTEHDLINHETDFIPYLVVSGLALDAFIIASILSAMAVAREFEVGTVKVLAAAPIHPLVPILGRVLATNLMATGAMIFPLIVAMYGYQIIPLHPWELVGALLVCTAIFSCIGAALGTLLKRTLPVASLVVGLSLMLYLCSGSLEPERFDGNLIWVVAHISPVYYAVGILEQAFHELQVTPEPLWVHFVTLVGWAIGTLLLAGFLLRHAMVERSSVRPAKEKPTGARISLRWDRLWPQQSLVLPKKYWSLALCVLLIGGFWLTASQQQALAENVSRQQQNLSRQINADQQREAIFLRYTRTISDMILHDRLLDVKANGQSKIVAAKLTQDTLPQLDGKRKGLLLHFLVTARLIDDTYHILSLKGADFSGSQVSDLTLFDVDMTGANFSGADLHGIALRFAILTSVNFKGANLVDADLGGATLKNADLTNADLTDAYLGGAAGTTDEQLARAKSLSGATLPPDGKPGDEDVD